MPKPPSRYDEDDFPTYQGRGLKDGLFSDGATFYTPTKVKPAKPTQKSKKEENIKQIRSRIETWLVENKWRDSGNLWNPSNNELVYVQLNKHGWRVGKSRPGFSREPEEKPISLSLDKEIFVGGNPTKLAEAIRYMMWGN